MDAVNKDQRFRYGPVNVRKMANCPITTGPVDQSTDLTTLTVIQEAPGEAPGATNGPVVVDPTSEPQGQ